MDEMWNVYNFSFAVNMANFGASNGTLYSTQRRAPSNFIVLRSRLVFAPLIYHRLEPGSDATFAQLFQL